MKNRFESAFFDALDKLPPQIKNAVHRKFELFFQNSRHNSLQFKKVGRYWSIRINKNYRALARGDIGNLTWFWVGKHDAYERLISMDF